MNIYKRKLEKVGRYMEEDGKILCYLDRNKLLKKKILKKVDVYDEVYNVMKIDYNKLIQNIICDQNITYIFDHFYFDNSSIYLESLDLIYSYCTFVNEISILAKNIQCIDCTFLDNIKINANRINMKRNNYEGAGKYFQKFISLIGDTYLKDEYIDKRYSLGITAHQIEKVEIKNCNISNSGIRISNSMNAWKTIKTGVIDIIDTKIKSNYFETNFQMFNLKNSEIEMNNLLEIMDSDKFKSTDSVICAPEITLQSQSTNLTNSNLVSENTFIKSNNLTIINKKDNSIHADKGVYLEIKEDANFNNKDIHSPFIIFNDSIVSKSKEEKSADISLVEPRNKLVNLFKKMEEDINEDINKMNKDIEQEVKRNYNVSDFTKDKELPKIKVIKK